MRTSPRQSPRYPGAGLPPGASAPDVPGPEGEQLYAGPFPTGPPLDQQYAGYGTPEVDEEAYARALYGDGADVHAGPGTGLGYTDANWAGAPYGGSYYSDPDTTDPDLAGSAYGRAMYGDPGRSAPPLEDPALGHPGMGYEAGYGYGDDPSAMPAPGYADPDATGPMAGDRDQVDLAYYGPGGEPAYGYAQPQAPAYGPPEGYAPAYGTQAMPAVEPAGYGQPTYAPAEPDYYDDDPYGDPYEEDAGPDGYSLPVRQLRRRSLGRAASRRASELVNGASMTIVVGVVAVVIGLGLAIVAGRMMTTRQLFFSTHATAGIVLVHAFGGGLTTLVTRKETRTKEMVRRWSTIAMAGAAWVTMIVGTFFGYAGYRATPRPGVVNLNAYPQKFLWADKGLAFWDTFGMEWKVNSGWLIPFLTTAVAFVVLKYNRLLVRDLRLRKMLTNLFLMAFAVAIVGSMLGFILNTVAPNDFMHRPWHI
jgi:hypothetical protein